MSTRAPRPVLTRNAPRFIAVICSRPMTWCVSAVSGTCSVMMSLLASRSSKETKCAPATVFRLLLHASTRHPNPCRRRITAPPMWPTPRTPTVMSRRSRPRTPAGLTSGRAAELTISVALRITISISIRVKSATPSGAYTTFSTVIPRSSAASRSMWSRPMLRVEMYSTPDSINERRCRREISDLCPTLMHRVPGTELIVASETAARVVVAATPKRGASSWNRSSSS